MQLSPYLTFHGQCEAAFKFYEQCLGGKLVAMLTHADSPMADQTPPSCDVRPSPRWARCHGGNRSIRSPANRI